MQRPVLPPIQRLDPWKHGPAVLKLFAEDFGGDATGGPSIEDDMAPTRLVEIDDSVGFVWVEGNEVLGAITCLPNSARKDTWIVANLVTDERFRRRGIGRALLDAAARFIQQLGKIYVALQVNKNNLAAINLYRRSGFDVIGEIAHYRMTPKTLLTPVRHVEVRHASKQDADAVWRLATASYPGSLGFAEPLDLDRFQLKPSRFRYHQTGDAPQVFVDVSSPVTSGVSVQDESLDGSRRRFELRPVFDPALTTAECGALLIAVLRTLSPELADEVVVINPANAFLGELVFHLINFKPALRMLHLRKPLASG